MALPKEQKDMIVAGAKDLANQFFAALKAQAPSDKEIELVTWATQTIVAAPLLIGTQADVAEKLGHAKTVLADIEDAHLIDGVTAASQIMNAAIAKGIAIVESLAMSALKLAVVA